MKSAVILVLNILIGIFEVRLCYEMLFYTVLDKRYIQLKEKVIVYGSSVIVGALVGINRQIVFFSHVMFIVSVILISFCAWLAIRRQIVTIFSLVFVYTAVLALMDFFCAFSSMYLLQQQFAKSVYLRPETWWPVLIYIISRAAMIGGIYIMSSKIDVKFDIREYTQILIIMCLILLIVLRQYQDSMVQMVFGEKGLAGKEMSLSLISVMLIGAIILILLLKYEMIKKENDFLTMQEDMLMQKYIEVERNKEENARIIHDIKYDLLMMEGYAKEKEYEKLERYLSQITKDFYATKSDTWTQNRICDLILQQKKAEAEQKGITVEINAVFISQFPFTEREICALFGNLLDNAIVACDKVVDGEKSIRIKIEGGVAK